MMTGCISPITKITVALCFIMQGAQLSIVSYMTMHSISYARQYDLDCQSLLSLGIVLMILGVINIIGVKAGFVVMIIDLNQHFNIWIWIIFQSIMMTIKNILIVGSIVYLTRTSEAFIGYLRSLDDTFTNAVLIIVICSMIYDVICLSIVNRYHRWISSQQRSPLYEPIE